MNTRRILAVGGALAVLALVTAASALAAGTRVSVRVEGVKRTLLRAKTVTAPSTGSITKGHTPPGACPARTAAGALNAAAKGRWGGSYSTQFAALSVTSILGETHPLTTSSKYYWSIWVNDKYAPAGICGLKLHRGERLLFAAVPTSGIPYPIVVSAPRRATVGHRFRVKVSYVGAKGRKALAGATVNGHGATNGAGVITLTASRPGRDRLTLARPGYIRAEATVAVSR